MENHVLPSLSLSPQLGIQGMALWLVGREEVRLVSSRGKFGKFSHSGRVTGKLSACIHVTDDSCNTGSTYTGCVVNGRIARAAS